MARTPLLFDLLGPLGHGDAGRRWAFLSAKALGYDPYRQTWEKRLARYLSWQWRIRAKDGAYSQPYRVETLLEHAGEELNARAPSRTKERLEKALDRLQADEVIAGWQYDRFDDWGSGESRARGGRSRGSARRS